MNKRKTMVLTFAMTTFAAGCIVAPMIIYAGKNIKFDVVAETTLENARQEKYSWQYRVKRDTLISSLNPVDVELPGVDMDAYEFVGWYKDEACEDPYGPNDSVTHDMLIYAKFLAKTYNINISEPAGLLEGENIILKGTDNVEASNKVYYDDDFVFKLDSNVDKYDLSKLTVTVNDQEINSDEYGYFHINNIKSDVEIALDNLQVKSFSITKTQENHFSYIGAIEDNIHYGDSISFGVDLDEAYDKSNVVVSINGMPIEAVNGRYIIANIQDAVVITVEGVTKNTYAITKSVENGFSFTGTIEESVEYGDSITFGINLDKSYNNSIPIVKVITDSNPTGETLTATNGVYTISDINEDITIIVSNIVLNLAYTVDTTNNTATITGIGTETATDIEIPSTILHTDGNCYTVTSIGNGAFYNCRDITSIILPDGLTTIGYSAFNYCKGLTGIVIPNSVTFIGGSAFEWCESLTNITIPDGVTKIENNTFSVCSSVNNIVIPDSVTSIGFGAFNGCSRLTGITIPENVTYIEEEAFMGCKRLNSITIDSATIASLTTSDIENGDCDYSYILEYATKVYVKENLTVGTYITDSLALIESDKEGYVLYANVLALQNPDFIWSGTIIAEYIGTNLNVVIPYGATEISTFAFSWNKIVTSVVISDSVTTIDSCAFSQCPNLTSVLIGNGVTKIENMAFYDCSSLTSVVIGGGVTRIDFSSFNECPSLNEVTIDSATIAGLNSSNSNLLDNATRVYLNTDITDVGTYITNSFIKVVSDKEGYNLYLKPSEMGNYLANTYIDFEWDGTTITGYNGQETDIVIPYGSTEIGESAFEDKSDITSVVISSSVTSIGDSAFNGSTSLTQVTIDSQTIAGLNSSDSCLFDNASTAYVKQGLAVGDWITGLYGQTESDKQGYNKYVPMSTIYPEYSWQGTTLIEYTGADTEVVIPSGTTSLGENAFKDNKNVTSVTLPSTIKYIGGRAFQGCSALTSVELPEGLETLDFQAFAQCTNLTEITLPSTLKTIGRSCFAGSTKLAEIEFSDSIEAIGDFAFYQTSLTEVELPEGVETFGQGIFRECSKLTSVVLPDSLEIIPKGMFYKCPKLASVEIPASVKQIDEGAFYQCTSLSNVTLSEGLEKISRLTFYQCTALTSITLPDSVEEIGHAAFSYCNQMTSITLSQNLKKLDQFAFNECRKLEAIELPDTLEEIGKCAFQACIALEEINLPSSLKFIGDFALNHCFSLNLTSITIPASVVQIGGDEFVGDNEENGILGSHVFYDCATPYLVSFYVEEGNTHFVAKDGVLYTKNYKYLIAYPPANTRTSYEIEDGCEMMYELALSRAHYLKSLKLPNSFVIKPSSELPSTWLNNTFNSLDCGIYMFDALTEYLVNDDNPNYKSVDGILYSKDGTKLVAVPTQKWDDSGSYRVLSFADEMTTIDYILKELHSEASYNGQTVAGYPKVILLGENVTNICENAFLNISEISTIKIFTELESRPDGWADNLGIAEDRIFYYSETEQSGNYWHYVDGFPSSW